jgi:ATP-binding cassette subfamily B protein
VQLSASVGAAQTAQSRALRKGGNMGFVTQGRNILAAWSRALRLTWQSSPLLTFLALLSSMFIGLAVPVQVWISKVMIDAVAGALATGTTSAQWTTFVLPALAFIAVWIVSHAMESATGNMVTVLAQYAMLRGQMLIAHKAASMDVASFEDPTFHNQLKLARDQVFRIYNVTFQLIQAATQVITLISLLILLGSINIILPLILLACTLPKVMLQTRHEEQRIGIFHN